MKTVISIELFKEDYLDIFLKWFENPKNTKYMLIQNMTKDRALKITKNDEDKKVYCIKLKNNPIGYCMLYNIKTKPELVILIDEPYTGKGYGLKAMQLLEKEAKSLGVSIINLTVNKFNYRAISLYKQLDYKKEFIIMKKTLN